MIVKPALAAMLASGLIVPEAPKLVLPKPAIVKAENLELTRHILLGMPLTMGMLPGKASGVTYTYNTSVSSTTNSSTYSLTSVSIGTAADNRYVVVAVMGDSFGSNNNIAINSCTVDGAAMTRYAHGSGTSSQSNEIAIFITNAVLTTGTTATIAISFQASVNNVRVSTWSLYGLTSNVPVDSGLVTGSTLSRSTTVTAGGVLIAASKGVNNTTCTWTGVTERYDANVESRYGSSGDDAVVSSGSVTVSVTRGSPNSTDRMSVASFR